MGRLIDIYDGKSPESLHYFEYQMKANRRWHAQMEANEFFNSIKSSVDNFKVRLAKLKGPQFNDCPDWLQPYSPGLWCKLSFPPKNWMTTEMILKIAAQKLSLPEVLRDRVHYEISYGAWYVPSVRYLMIAQPPSPRYKGRPAKPVTGVPSLQWLMATYILSTAEFQLTEGIISVERYDFTQQIRCIPENLGKLYGGPEFWQYQAAFTTPLILLALLAWGKDELPGVDVLKRSSPLTIYAVEGFPGEITLHDDFCLFIRDMAKKSSLNQALLDRGMCDKETAGLVKAKLEKLKEPEALAAVLGIANGPESKTGDDYSDVVYRLTHQMGYKDAEAKAAAKFACEKHPNGTVLEKIKIALQSLGQ